MRNYTDSAEGDSRTYCILSRGNENTIVLTMEPTTERGQALLMRARPVDLHAERVAAGAPIAGPAPDRAGESNGDLTQANLAGDYTPTIAGRVNDRRPARGGARPQGGRSRRHLARVRYWVGERDQPTQRPSSTHSPVVCSRPRYEEFRQMARRDPPTRLVMEDALKRARSRC